MYKVYNNYADGLKSIMKNSGDRIMTSGTENQFKVSEQEKMTKDKCCK